jgi:hypothetical protein
MYPPSIALPDELREAYLPLLLHLLDEFEKPSVIGLVACYDIRSATQQVVTVLHATHQRIQFLASISAADHYRLSPRLAYGVE